MPEYWDPEIETMPVEELRKLQEEKLKTLVHYVYEHSPFYRKKFDEHGVHPDDIRTLEDVRKLPFTFKQDLRDTYPTGMFCVPNSKLVRFHASSGTTGKPTVVGYTRNDINEWAESLARAFTSIGVGKEDVIQISYGYGLFTGGLGVHYATEKVGATVLPTSSGNTERQLELMRDLGSTVIACTPSYFSYMIEAARKEGFSIRDDTGMKIGIFGAEPWSEELRVRIEKESGIKAYDIYGTSELSGPLFTECKDQCGIHIWADKFLVEILDPETGEPVPDGETGELVITTLTKEALPLIRYKVLDLTRKLSEPCKCGRTHPRITRITGRVDDMLIIRGINVFPGQVESVLMKIPEVGNHFMIIVDRAGELDVMKVQIEMHESAFSDRMSDMMALEKKIAYALKAVLNLAVQVELVEHGFLPRSEGKSKKVIDNRKL
ncbi:Phenylacetate-coenzyme A ligase [Methanosarcina sp. MTP4]|uniref:phenylacetate--CoA ligase family protein n=1 Tax=Methanosarcina sp. MTP4 TaxID=1434100 RepID=UPI00061574C0|nr:phenylacetate--CoA ligase [Methanosarcina sp. MTP4]AKB24171.1 Phenylacetate-coenzyme A ligase [Methanosarcina sp. MTP4]